MLELSLARKLRFKSVRAMYSSLTGPEVMEWLAYFRLESEDAEKRQLQREARQAAMKDLAVMSSPQR